MISYKNFIFEKLKIKKIILNILNELNQVPEKDYILNTHSFYMKAEPAIQIKWIKNFQNALKEREDFKSKFKEKIKNNFNKYNLHNTENLELYIVREKK